MGNSPSCLVIGAGMTGLTAARCLRDAGLGVVVIDKGHHMGGRMATRRLGTSRLDHGAQFFTARDSRFVAEVQKWEAAGWVAPWYAHEGQVRYRAVGGMNALAAYLAEGLDVRTGTKAVLVETADDRWRVTTESGEVFSADALLVTAPAPQTADLLAGCAEQLPPHIIPLLNGVVYDPCFALLVTIDGPSLVPAPGCVRVDGGPVAWIADNAQKGVSSGENAALTIHASVEFSRDYFDAGRDEVARWLLEAAAGWLGGSVTAWHLHRWKYARPVVAERPWFLSSREPAALVIAGDGFGGPRVEGAFLSGLAGAMEMLPKYSTP